jgi:hypothetical protein
VSRSTLDGHLAVRIARIRQVARRINGETTGILRESSLVMALPQRRIPRREALFRGLASLPMQHILKIDWVDSCFSSAAAEQPVRLAGTLNRLP